jgi:hypothetical protein
MSPRITGAVIDEDFLAEMRRALRRGVRIRLGYGISRDADAGLEDSALERLRRLAGDYRKLELSHLRALKLNALVLDGRLAAITNFPLLAHRGDATRALGDERGWLLSAHELVADERERWEREWQGGRLRELGPAKTAARHAAADGRRRRRPRRE